MYYKNISVVQCNFSVFSVGIARPNLLVLARGGHYHAPPSLKGFDRIVSDRKQV